MEPQLISVLASTRGLRPDAKAMHWAAVENLVEQMWDEDPGKRPSASSLLLILKALQCDGDRKGEGTSNDIQCNVNCKCAVM